MHQQALLLMGERGRVNGGEAQAWEGEMARAKEGRRRVVFKDAAAMGKLPPAHGIDAVHLAQ